MDGCLTACGYRLCALVWAGFVNCVLYGFSQTHSEINW